jgi:hypothetical protein
MRKMTAYIALVLTSMFIISAFGTIVQAREPVDAVKAIPEPDSTNWFDPAWNQVVEVTIDNSANGATLNNYRDAIFGRHARGLRRCEVHRGGWHSRITILDGNEHTYNRDILGQGSIDTG